MKYRGIFLNDEQPALQNWAQEKFTNNYGGINTGKGVGGDPTFGASGDPTASGSGTDPAFPFNRFFYTRLFELILRLKANYLWPGELLKLHCAFNHPSSHVLSGPFLILH